MENSSDTKPEKWDIKTAYCVHGKSLFGILSTLPGYCLEGDKKYARIYFL